MKIPFSRALSCIKAAERLAIANGHAKYDSNGAVNLPAAQATIKLRRRRKARFAPSALRFARYARGG